MNNRKNKRVGSVDMTREIKFGRKLLLSRDGKTSTALWAMRVLFKGLALRPSSRL